MAKKHFVEDNKGSGFAVEGGGDIDSLLSFATSSVEDEEGDTSHFFMGMEGASEESKPTVTPTPKDVAENSKIEKEEYEQQPITLELSEDEEDEADVNFELEDEEYSEGASNETLSTSDHEESYVEPEDNDLKVDSKSNERWDASDESHNEGFNTTSSEEINNTEYYDEDEYYSSPVSNKPPKRDSMRTIQEEDFQQTSSVKEVSNVNEAPQQHRRFNIPSESDQIDFALKVINVIDTYRSLKSDEKAVVEQIITNEDETTGDESRIAIKAINADPMLSITMKNFREAKESEAVDRAFYVISLPDNHLFSLGNMASAFTNEYIDESLGKIEYARKLVDAIAKLDNNAVKYITSTESVLAAASEEKNK